MWCHWSRNPSAEIAKDSYEHKQRGRGNNEIELITGIEVDNEDTDHTLAVPVPPIIIHNLGNQIDLDIDIDMVNISVSVCLYLFCLFVCLFFPFRLSIQITLKK